MVFAWRPVITPLTEYLRDIGRVDLGLSFVRLKGHSLEVIVILSKDDFYI